MPRSEPDEEQHQAEEKRHHRFDRSVRVDPLDQGVAEEQAETTRDARTKEKPAQERDAVPARALAPEDQECRGQHERTGCRGDGVEQDVSGLGHRIPPPFRKRSVLSGASRPDAPGMSGLNSWRARDSQRVARDLELFVRDARVVREESDRPLHRGRSQAACAVVVWVVEEPE